MPDHGKLAPWRFLVIEGEAGGRLGAVIAGAYAADTRRPTRTALDSRARAPRPAPLVVAVVSGRPARQDPRMGAGALGGRGRHEPVLAANAWASPPPGSPSGSPMTAGCSTRSASTRGRSSPASSISAGRGARRPAAAGPRRHRHAARPGGAKIHEAVQRAGATRPSWLRIRPCITTRNRTLPHDPLKALVAPRPIGWISAMSRAGQLNLAPYSFFNAVAAAAMVAFSSWGRRTR